MFCENHPEKETNARCEYCWKPICADCLVTIGKKSYCSRQCFRRLFFHNLRFRTKQFFFRQDLYLRSKIENLHKYSTVCLILGGLCIFVLFYYSSSTEERRTNLPKVLPKITANVPLENPEKLNVQEEESSGKEKSDSGEASLKNMPFSIGIVSDNPPPPPYIVAICGEAPSDSIVALYNNGRLCDTVPCRKGRFLFPRVRLKRDKNLLQAKLITPNGDFLYSNKMELAVDVATSQIEERGVDLRRGELGEKKICLSFDGGSNADDSAVILDILKEKQIQTTIFLTGEFIRRNPKIVMRMMKEGHEIGNHTDTHPHLAKLEDRQFKALTWVNREFVHRELKKAEEAFYHLTGRNMIPYWRSPYGESNLEIRKWAEELGYMHVSWTCGRAWENGLDSLDWVTDTSSVRYHTAKEIREQIVNFGEGSEFEANGGIVLMHLSTSRKPRDAVYTKLDEIIEGLEKRGYAITKISELLPKKENEQLKSAKKENLLDRRSNEEHGR